MSKSPLPVLQARAVLIALAGAIAATVGLATPRPVADGIELFEVGEEFGPQELAVSANSSLLAFRNGGIGTQHSLCVVSAEDGKLSLRQVIPGGTKARFIDKSDEADQAALANLRSQRRRETSLGYESRASVVSRAGSR